jgi:HD domain-containing protein
MSDERVAEGRLTASPAAPSIDRSALRTQVIAGVSAQDGPVIAAAAEYAGRLSEPYLFNHAMRSWLFAELIGRAKGIDLDREVVAVGTILHDIGLTSTVSGAQRFEVNGADAARSFVRAHGFSDRRAQLVWDLVALNSTPSLALHKEPEVAVGTMGIGLDYGGFGLDALAAGEVDRVLGEFPRLRMKDRFSEACCRLVKERPETAHDNFLRDFGERFVPGYRAVSTVDLLVNAPFDE